MKVDDATATGSAVKTSRAEPWDDDPLIKVAPLMSSDPPLKSPAPVVSESVTVNSGPVPTGLFGLAHPSNTAEKKFIVHWDPLRSIVVPAVVKGVDGLPQRSRVMVVLL